MHIDWCCPRVHIETQGRSYHHGKGLVCTDVECGGFECRLQVLLQCTPVLLRSRDGWVAVNVSGIHTYAFRRGAVLVWSGRCSCDGPLALPFPEGGEGMLCGEPRRDSSGSGMLDAAAAAVVVDGN